MVVSHFLGAFRYHEGNEKPLTNQFNLSDWTTDSESAVLPLDEPPKVKNGVFRTADYTTLLVFDNPTDTKRTEFALCGLCCELC